ncbi:MAG: hypothetical protein ACKOBF_05000 [Limnohabitans sp.]
MKSSALRFRAASLAAVWFGVLAPSARATACEPGALIEALSPVGATPARAVPDVARQRPVDATALSAVELSRLPAMARTDGLLRQAGVPWAWHRLDASRLETALQEAGGTLIVAALAGEGAEPACQVLTRSTTAARAGESPDPDRPAEASAGTLLALLPMRDARSPEPIALVQDVLRAMRADFRLAMRMGVNYAPQGFWVVSPWLTEGRIRRGLDMDGPVPGLQGRAETRVGTTGVGLGLTRGLTRDTSLTLLLSHQRSRLDTTVTFPAIGPVPAQRIDSTGHQEDTLLGVGLYSRIVRQGGVLPAVLLDARAFAPSAHSRTGGSASLSTLYELERGWAVVASVGADTERPEAGPSRHGRFATAGASVQLSPRWMLTLDAGRKELRDLPGSQPLQRARLYRSLGSLAYLALVVDRDGPDRRAAVTFARPL